MTKNSQCYRLMLVRENNPQYKIKSSNDVYDVIKQVIPLLWNSPVEVFGFFGLDNANNIIMHDFSQSGNVNESRVYISNIAKKLLLSNCSQVILIHNHPSGNLKASDSDIDITNKIKQALSYFEIKVLDHIIAGEDDFLSFKEMGYIE